MFLSNAISMFLYFVGRVVDEKTGNISTWVNGWKYFRSINQSIKFISNQIKKFDIQCTL